MKDIRLLVLDVDGTLTDGKIYMGAEGEVCKAFSIKDGLGLRLMADSGVTLAILTGRESRIVQNRAAELKIPHVIQNVQNQTRSPAPALPGAFHPSGGNRLCGGRPD